MAESCRLIQKYLFTFFILVSAAALVNAQDDDCSVCWRELKDVAAQMSQSVHEEFRPSDLTERYPVKFVRRSVSTYGRSQCSQCWVALNVLLSDPPQPADQTGENKFRSMVKKAMLNNGWV